MKRGKITLIFVAALVVLAGAALWYSFLRDNKGALPSLPPTADDVRRMEEVERTSNTIAPNAIPGAGVRPRGSLPAPTPPVATTTGADGSVDESATTTP